MVCHVLLKGQGWSPDHPDQLPLFPHSGLSFQTVRNKSAMVCAMFEIFRKWILKKRKKGQEWSLIQSLLWAQGSQLTFIYFVKVGYYPLLALACTCILIHIVIVYCI